MYRAPKICLRLKLPTNYFGDSENPEPEDEEEEELLRPGNMTDMTESCSN